VAVAGAAARARDALQDDDIGLPNLLKPSRPVHCPFHATARVERRQPGAAAHSHYNSLIRRVVSFAHALEREQSRS